MKILFLGGTGNISAECAALLHQRGHEIQVMTRGRGEVPAEYSALRADRKDPVAMRSAIRSAGPEVVIDFIAYEIGEVRAAWEMLKGHVRQYIFISSATVYQKAPPRLPITEDTPLGNAYWDYAQRKVECEEWLRERWEEERFPVTMVRPSHTYSKRWVPNPVSSSSYTFAARLEQGLPVFVPDDGENPWTLTAAADFAVGLAGLVGQTAALGQAFHITSDEVLTWNRICAETATALGVAAPRIMKVPTDFICRVAPQLTGTLKGDKAHPGVFDNAKIKRFVPDFQCRVLFSEGVRQSVAWLRAHPDQQNLNPQVDTLCDAVVSAWRHARTG